MADNNKTAGAIGLTTVLAIVAAVAANFKPIVEGLAALWLLLVAFTKDAPLGVLAFFLSIALGVMSRFFLMKYLKAADLWIDLLAIGIGAGIMLVQLHSFLGVLTGILAGLIVPYLARLIETAWLAGARLIGRLTP